MRHATCVVVALCGSLVLYKSAACVLPTPHGCNEIGCSDGVFAEVAFSDGVWPVGVYQLELQFDDRRRVCSFGFPADLPVAGSNTSVRCEPRDPQLEVQFGQTIECVEERTGDAVSHSCESLPEQYSLRINLIGAPSRLQLRLERDAVLVSQQELTLKYAESQPNGPECGPVCRQSNVEIRVD